MRKSEQPGIATEEWWYAWSRSDEKGLRELQSKAEGSWSPQGGSWSPQDGESSVRATQVHSASPSPGFSKRVAAPGAGPSDRPHSHSGFYRGCVMMKKEDAIWVLRGVNGVLIRWCVEGFAVLWYVRKRWLDGQVNGWIDAYTYSFLAEIEAVILLSVTSTNVNNIWIGNLWIISVDVSASFAVFESLTICLKVVDLESEYILWR